MVAIPLVHLGRATSFKVGWGPPLASEEPALHWPKESMGWNQRRTVPLWTREDRLLLS